MAPLSLWSSIHQIVRDSSEYANEIDITDWTIVAMISQSTKLERETVLACNQAVSDSSVHTYTVCNCRVSLLYVQEYSICIYAIGGP